MNTVRQQVEEAFSFLLENGAVSPGSLVILGCSTSEILGGTIGKSGSAEVGAFVVQGALHICAAHNVHLAVQCCEHLNRALVLPRSVAALRGYPAVAAIPHPRAGGACAAAAWRLMQPDVVLVEAIEADAGVDIGATLIGMHLKPVAVPLRPPMKSIEMAHLTMAFSRPKYIGGPRTHYTDEE